MPSVSGSEGHRPVLRFLGRRFVVFAAIAFVAATLAGVIDYCFALIIQLFLFAMGIGATFAPALKFPALGRPLVVGELLIAFGVLRALFGFLQGFAAGIAQEHASSRIRQAAIFTILPREDQGPRMSAAEAFFIYSEVSGKAAVYLLNLVKFLAAILQTVILGAAMLYLSWMDCLIAAALLAVASVIILRINVHIGRVAKSNPRIWSESVAAIESAGRNWFYIRIKHLYESERSRLYRLNFDVEGIGFRLRRLTEISPALVSALAIIILAVLANTRALVTHTAPTVFLSFLYVFLRFSQSLGESARDGSGLIEYKPYFERLRALLPILPDDERTLAVDVVDKQSPWRSKAPAPSRQVARVPMVRPATLRAPGVALSDISFRYDDGRPWVLRHVDVDVAPGSQLAIIGPSGCGKSTLLAVILGFLRPASGRIDVGGIAPERFCQQFAEYIGYVGPEPYIVTGTVRDNMLFGSNGVYSDEQIWRALSLAALGEVIEALPARLDTPLRHHDVQLSMGQRQRLALARALLPEPALLILDEASANLDEATEEAIALSIKALKGTTTTIIVSHKLGLVRYADRLIDLSSQQGHERDSRSAP